MPVCERELQPVLHLLSHDDFIWVVVLVREGVGGGGAFVLNGSDGREPFCVESWVVVRVEAGGIGLGWNCGDDGRKEDEDQGKLWGYGLGVNNRFVEKDFLMWIS